MEKMIGVTVKINNLPKEIDSGFMVARVHGVDLWYYGIYHTEKEAMKVAVELGNGIILKV